ncbi:hypothetical protein COU15_01290 [Candidatus Kaiserbacteria bacterium CG10_big_fil_rev_8_21_14_0_10_45_20]|uniref:Uncharacterized protein n=1 Tax=Candidatus Kaiserbacteria bacterium CG10_big_fil_rev_8_21_14_0_10_45_20 TaxID=1974607 RepID=A0A2H0UG41_9BACT|nr:MAG: hypothetical protein COU15_01290 [Candidatus Kaiserbacteria bacterium CG10_big_fil_rev_8_21_14_0_10_45_20]
MTRNELAYIIFVERVKEFARARGIRDPFVAMPHACGEVQRRKGGKKPIVLEYDDAMQVVAHVKRNCHID